MNHATNHLLGHLTLGIIVILNGVDDNLRCYDLAIELDIRLGCADYSAALIFIIILFFGFDVNRPYNIFVIVVDVFVSGGFGFSNIFLRYGKTVTL